LVNMLQQEMLACTACFKISVFFSLWSVHFYFYFYFLMAEVCSPSSHWKPAALQEQKYLQCNSGLLVLHENVEQTELKNFELL
jgi:hypothetical protein